MSTYGQRLLEAMEFARVTQDDLAKAAGIKQPSVNYLIKKGSGSKHTNKFANLCGINASWLETGHGKMTGKSTAHKEIKAEPSAESAALKRILAKLENRTEDELNSVSSMISVLFSASDAKQKNKGKAKL